MAENGKWRNRIIETVQMRVGDLAANKYNPKAHPASQETRVEAVLEKFGIVDSLIAWKSDRNNGAWTIFDGHLRQKLDPDQVWTVHKTSLRDEEVDELVFYFDPLAGMSLHDEAKMAALMQDLGDVDGVLGEMLRELAEGVGLAFGGDGDGPEDPGPQLDKAAELQEVWQVQRGQVWQAGQHKLMCGDSTCAEDVKQLMGGERAAITFTSPPYNAGVSAQLSGNTSIGDNLYRDAYDDNRPQSEWLMLMRGFTDCALAVSDYLFVNVQLLAGNKLAFVDYWHEYRGKFADVAIWDKTHAAPQQAQRVMDSRFEFVLIFSHGGTRAVGTREFRGMVHNVYSGTPQRHNEYASSHAATYPVDLPAHFITIFTNPGDGVLDPFIGTGTTLVACEQTARIGYGMEIEPKYCSVALQRLKDMGLEPRLVEG